MNHCIIAESAFSGTTVDLAPVRRYLLNMNLGYYENAYHRGENEQALRLLNHTEVFEIHFRRYLAGASKTLHHVLVDVRLFLAYNSHAASGMIQLVILQIRRHFLNNEWYELMPRFEKAVIKIEKQLK